MGPGPPMVHAGREDALDLSAVIRAVPDHPKPGITYRDITPLLGDPQAMAETTRLFAENYKARGLSKVAGIEARGFVFGAALAHALGAGFVPVRKVGKLPRETYKQSYTLEYGEDTLEMHRDAVAPGERVLLIDDLLATGGTAVAAAKLLAEAGAETAGAAFVIELDGLPGRARLAELPLETFALMRFPA